MKLEEIRICNFKGLKEARFQPMDFACLVGENNAGKSSVLQAIVTSLNRPSYIPSSLFYDDTLPVEFVSRFSGITLGHLQRLAEEHRLKIEELVIDECLTIITRYRLDEKVEVRVLKRIPKEARYQVEAIDEHLKGKKGPAIRQVILDNYPEFSPNLPGQLNVTLAKSYLSIQINLLDANAFEMQERALPSGISSSISALLPETIYIPAVKNLSDDLKTTQSTSFGRLLGLLLEDMSPDLEEINASLGQLKETFQ